MEVRNPREEPKPWMSELRAWECEFAAARRNVGGGGGIGGE